MKPTRSARMFALVVTLLCGMSVVACGQQGTAIEWKTLNQEVMELLRTGQYDRGVILARKALQVAEQNVGPDHPDVAVSLNNLAGLYDSQGKYAQAEPLLERAGDL